MRPVTIAAAALCACAIVLGLTLGQKAAKLSETDVIEFFATQYVSDTGRPRTDCQASPGASAEVWIIVKCGQGTGQKLYFVDFQGNRIVMPADQPKA